MARSAQTPESNTYDWNMDEFHIRQLFKHIHTGIPCQVTDVFPLPPGYAKANKDGIMGLVHVKPAVDQYDNSEPPKAIQCNKIFNVPYFRVQAGNAALVIDPEVDDWGWIHFGERDITKWKNTKKIELPPSRRILAQSDGGYFPGVLNKPPEVWIRIRRDGIFVEGKDQPITVNTTGNCQTNCNNAIVNAMSSCNISGNGGVSINEGGAANVQGNNSCCAGSCSPTFKDSCCGCSQSQSNPSQGKMCCGGSSGSCSSSACSGTMKCKPNPVNSLLGKMCVRS